MEEEIEILQSIYTDEIVSIDLKWYLFLINVYAKTIILYNDYEKI